MHCSTKQGGGSACHWLGPKHLVTSDLKQQLMASHPQARVILCWGEAQVASTATARIAHEAQALCGRLVWRSALHGRKNKGECPLWVPRATATHQTSSLTGVQIPLAKEWPCLQRLQVHAPGSYSAHSAADCPGLAHCGKGRVAEMKCLCCHKATASRIGTHQVAHPCLKQVTSTAALAGARARLVLSTFRGRLPWACALRSSQEQHWCVSVWTCMC